ALAPDQGSQFAQDRSSLFGNDRTRPTRFNERRRNHFPDRIRRGAGRQAQRKRQALIAIARRARCRGAYPTPYYTALRIFALRVISPMPTETTVDAEDLKSCVRELRRFL